MWTRGTCTVRLQSANRSPQQTIKLQRAVIERQTLGLDNTIHSLNHVKEQIPGLLGEQTTIHITINGIETTALLDTGATVCTISTDFYQQYLRDVPIQPIDDIVKIRCADGEAIPYLGYIKVTINTADIDTASNNDCLMLVVPTTQYSQKVPAIIGTNFINSIMDSIHQQNGERFLQHTKMTTPWYIAFRCIGLREKELQRNKHRLGVVKSAESNDIIIPPNTEVRVSGYVDKQIPYQPVCALLQATNGSVLPQDLDISPTLVSYRYQDNDVVDVNISNITTRTVRIPPKALICELQPVLIEDIQPHTDLPPGDQVIDLLKISTTNLTQDQHQQAHRMLDHNKDIFSTSDTDIGHSNRVQHKIHLDDNTPFKQRHRRIPPSMIEEVRKPHTTTSGSRNY